MIVVVARLFLATGRRVEQDDRMHVYGLLWIGIGAAVVACVTVWLFFRRASTTDLGSVSSHWMVEHRNGSD
jgi:hypothetical protein